MQTGVVDSNGSPMIVPVVTKRDLARMALWSIEWGLLESGSGADARNIRASLIRLAPVLHPEDKVTVATRLNALEGKQKREWEHIAVLYGGSE